MIRKLSKLFIVCFLIIYGFFSYSFSATLQVTRIGALDLGGKVYNEWWYSGINPTFYGKAAANSEVTITVGQNSFKTTSSADGDWSYAAVLQAGDYDLSFSQGSEKVSFKLHLGQNVPANSAGQVSQSTTPITGRNQMVGLAMGAGLLLLATYFYITGDPRRKSVFEAKILKEE
jgi:hypothetical protein